MKNDPLLRIAAKIRSSRAIVITSHLRPDGDSICTGLALAGMLESLGKRVQLINQDPTPFPFTDLPAVRRIKVGQVPPGVFDLAILLECANVSRSGQESLDGYYQINIDHHHSNDTYADINWIDPSAPAVGEMAFTLAERMKLPVTPEIAGHLYCAIVSDTGCFQFSNTTARAFEVSRKLVNLGANPIKTTEFLFKTNSPQKIKLLGQVLSSLRINRRGNLATISMFRKTLDDLNLKEIDTEDITTLARSIKGVEVVLFFKEMSKDKFRVSVRSTDEANAAAVAEMFGGGGHMHAAGFTAVGPYASLIERIPRKVEALIRRKPVSSRRRRPASSTA